MQIERDLIEDTRVAFQRLRIAENKRNELEFFDWESSLNLESFFVCLRWMRKKAMRCLRCRIILISISISFHFKAAFAYLTEFEAIFAPWNWWESSLVSYDFDLRLVCDFRFALCNKIFVSPPTSTVTVAPFLPELDKNFKQTTDRTRPERKRA